MVKSEGARGVYFLANNKVFEQTVAFLRSFRTYNPNLPLCLIPYNDDYEQIAALKDTYHFSIFNDAELLKKCDEISVAFHGWVVGAYRKLATWEGMFESFLYIDVDTVVVDSVDFAFEHLKHGQYVASHSNLPDIRRWVWKDSIYETDILTPPQIAYSANTGFFASSRGLFPIKHCLAKMAGGLVLRDKMELLCMEQPFLNYLVVTSGYTFTSLLTLNDAGISPGIPLEFWAGTPGARVEGGKISSPWDRPVFLVHWAGIWQSCNDLDKLPYRELWEYYRHPDMATAYI